MTSTKEIKRFMSEFDNNMWLHKIFNKISPYIVKILIKTPITANQVTILSIIFGAIGIILITFPNNIIYSLGFFFLYFYWLLDLCDGPIARYKQSTSLRGKYLDYFGHLIIHPFIFLAIGLHLFNKSGNISNLILGTSVAFLFLFYFTNHKFYVILTKKGALVDAHNLSLKNNKTNTRGIAYQIQKSLRDLLNVVAYFFVANLITHTLSFFKIEVELTFYLLFFYLILYFILFIWQTFSYFKNLPLFTKFEN